MTQVQFQRTSPRGHRDAEIELPALWIMDLRQKPSRRGLCNPLKFHSPGHAKTLRLNRVLLTHASPLPT